MTFHRLKPAIELAGLLLLTTLALAGRLWQGGSLPPGLHFDEAADGLIARSVLAGRWRVFYPEFTGKEPLYMWLLALGQLVWGRTVEGVRLPAALVGAATLPVAWWALRSIFAAYYKDHQARLAAWLGTLALAVSYWHLHLSRLGFRAILLPLAVLLAYGALWAAIRRGRTGWWVAAGLLNALPLYTYLSGRFAPLAPAAFAGYLLLFHRARLLDYIKRNKPALLAGVAAFGAGVAPLALYFLFNRRDFFERTGQVSVLQPLGEAPGKLARSLLEAARMFGLEGSGDLKYNSPGRPLFDWPLALAFYAGLALALYRWRRPVPAFLLLWLGIMLLPAVLSGEGNHPLRAGGAVPAALALAAFGLTTGWRWLANRVSPGRWVGAVVMAGALVWGLASTWQGYFGDWSRRADLYTAFDQDFVDFARLSAARARQAPGTAQVIVSDTPLHPTMIFLEPSLAGGRWLDLNHSLILPRELFEQNPPPAAEYLAPVRYLTNFQLKPVWQEWLGPDAVGVLPVAGYGGPGGAIYRYQPARKLEIGSLPIGVKACGEPVFGEAGDALALLGYRLRQDGRSLRLDLFWQARRATAEDYRMFVHLRPQPGSPELYGQGDANGAYSQAWRAGDVIIGHHEVKLDPRLAVPGRYVLEVGLYHTTNLQRLPLTFTPGPACTITPDPAGRKIVLHGIELK